MATWVRAGTGTAPSGTDIAVTGTYELDNATAPGDFDPDAVNSVRIQWTLSITAGAPAGSGPDSHTVDQAIDLTLNGNGTSLATTGSPTNQGPITTGTTSVANDETDSTISTGFTVAQWEGTELNPAGSAWTTFAQDKGPDGYTVSAGSVTVTIDYTPAVTSNVIAMFQQLVGGI